MTSKSTLPQNLKKMKKFDGASIDKIFIDGGNLMDPSSMTFENLVMNHNSNNLDMTLSGQKIGTNASQIQTLNLSQNLQLLNSGKNSPKHGAVNADLPSSGVFKDRNNSGSGEWFAIKDETISFDDDNIKNTKINSDMEFT